MFLSSILILLKCNPDTETVISFVILMCKFFIFLLYYCQNISKVIKLTTELEKEYAMNYFRFAEHHHHCYHDFHRTHLSHPQGEI